MADTQSGYTEPATPNLYLDAETTGRTVSGATVVRQRVLDPQVLAALASTLAVSAASLPLPSGAATEATQARRYAGGKTARTAQVTAVGDTTIHTPAAGKKIRLYWVSALNDPDQTNTPRIILKFGATELYRAYAVAHWEVFDGAVDQALVCNLDQAGDVAVTVHLEEI